MAYISGIFDGFFKAGLVPLTKLFNKSLQAGTFPKIWKEAFVTPIFKNSGSPSDVRQYRPISLLSCLSKILEKLVYSSRYSHLTGNNLISDRQSGYRAGHSTQLQLTYLTHNIYRYLDSGRDVTAIYLDISKYFDKIWHEGLLYKCKNDFFISGSLFSWLKSYLTDRTQRVRVGDAFSTTKMIKAGVPQGSVLGPLLALMYLDGLRHNLTNEILLYADDTSIHASHKTEDIDVVQDSLQPDLDNIDGYVKQWAIQFNITKTVQQTFSHKLHPTVPTLHSAGQNISTDTETHKHLGITFSTDLRFHNHVNNIIKKANIAMSPLYPIAKHIHRNTLSLIYTTYVRPHLDYCDIVFDGHITVNDELRLERVQRRAARLVKVDSHWRPAVRSPAQYGPGTLVSPSGTDRKLLNGPGSDVNWTSRRPVPSARPVSDTGRSADQAREGHFYRGICDRYVRRSQSVVTHMGYCLRLECKRSGVPLRKIQQNGQPIAGRVVVSRWLSALNFWILLMS